MSKKMQKRLKQPSVTPSDSLRPLCWILIIVWLNVAQTVCKRERDRERDYSFYSKNKALFTKSVGKLLEMRKKTQERVKQPLFTPSDSLITLRRILVKVWLNVAQIVFKRKRLQFLVLRIRLGAQTVCGKRLKLAKTCKNG